ncbi:hypothetical protein Mkiyose1665_29610 [Mycobacterium kiyosense]|uniref:Uncharacterized protein n=1 Tax=Mycobacterium kiyosense TaxID=2871094 RepID=A0A9P3UWZ6_9MYCO|nr:hypothetical protein IWGMT90018_09290 [Mycobacterium kiyosense]BDE12301.1 hypothetical protein MKCMC460_11610 [Mycobacterium sp. 20KCMC460]GLB84114.1 hypothetical protein SRL2020028_33700 [Mycobacterium kiyosense]GLB88539.1 hypothetical protein SRL2020130_13560 [Mycobacterium kiyosense]GLB94832.1 hypothetical protein SRL2020226_16080 [Mycobacterium kiyosense]
MANGLMCGGGGATELAAGVDVGILVLPGCASGGFTVAEVAQDAQVRAATTAASAPARLDANSLFGTLISVPPAKSCVF